MYVHITCERVYYGAFSWIFLVFLSMFRRILIEGCCWVSLLSMGWLFNGVWCMLDLIQSVSKVIFIVFVCL